MSLQAISVKYMLLKHICDSFTAIQKLPDFLWFLLLFCGNAEILYLSFNIGQRQPDRQKNYIYSLVEIIYSHEPKNVIAFMLNHELTTS